jgi:hypothetical protein
LIQESKKMQSRLTITLDSAEKNALQKLSRYEYREIHRQAAVIIRDELMRRGLLQADSAPNTPLPVEDPKQLAPA